MVNGLKTELLGEADSGFQFEIVDSDLRCAVTPEDRKTGDAGTSQSARRGKNTSVYGAEYEELSPHRIHSLLTIHHSRSNPMRLINAT